MLLVVVVFFSLFVFTASDYIAPEALINIAHIPFPEDQLAARVLKLQRDNFGLPSGVRCSSLVGPKCASQQAVSDQGHHRPQTQHLSPYQLTPRSVVERLEW